MKSSWIRRRTWGTAAAAGTVLLTIGAALVAQTPAPPPPPRPLINAPTDAQLRGFRWRSIGPTGQGGRIDDLAVDEKAPSTYYIGYAVSGRKTSTTARRSSPSSIPTASRRHDLALAPSDPNILYVGTGERTTARPRASATDLKSTDAGAHFTNIADTRTASPASSCIRRIRTSSAAAGGHLHGPNASAAST